MPRAILHFDVDAFFASVEQAADRHLRRKPIAVGNLHRGIVASASYEARRYGVYTPMPMSKARRLCPQLVVVPPHFDLYEQFSENIFGLAEEYTPLIERQSIDEGYLDLSGASQYLHCDAEAMAGKLQHAVKDWLKVTISQGLASTKLLSQIAGKLHKPNGFKVIAPNRREELGFLHPLPVKWLPGIGPVGSKLFGSAGITRIEQVAHMPVNWLAELIGGQARQLKEFANNIDNRAVEASAPAAQSFGHQKTFDTDTADAVFIEATILSLLDHAFRRVRAVRKQVRTVTVKLRYTDMYENQGQMSLPEPTDVEERMYPLVSRLLHKLWKRRVRLRMVQITLSKVYSGFSQLDLFGHKQRQHDLVVVCDAIRERFGPQAIMRSHDCLLVEETFLPQRRQDTKEWNGKLRMENRQNTLLACDRK